MLHTIVVPVDGSQFARRAVAGADLLAQAANARLVFTCVVSSARVATEDRLAQDRPDFREANNELEQVVAGATRQGQSATARLLQGEVAAAIVALARSEGADLIVMSTHGHGGLGRWVYGSVADAVLRTAVTPVLLVPPLARFDWGAAAPFRIVVPLDGSALAEVILNPVLDIARALQAELILLHALPPAAGQPDSPRPGAAHASLADMATARHYLDGVAARSGVPSSLHLAAGPAHHVILDATHAEGAHLVAMATHGRSGLARLVMGSVSEAVLRGSQTPMLLMRSLPAFIQAYEDQHPGPEGGGSTSPTGPA